jgi:hypothetical protein
MAFPHSLRTTERGWTIAGRIRLKNARMEIALAADRARVPEPRRHNVDGLKDALTRDALVPRRAQFG